ncbi:hypothetical protein J4P41_06630 [Gluconobacter sp. NFX36]|uniref:SH3 domain-containing protein n=1 Tax=Gluconobacter TaxID=441 RepID=UPI003CF159AB
MRTLVTPLSRTLRCRPLLLSFAAATALMVISPAEAAHHKHDHAIKADAKAAKAAHGKKKPSKNTGDTASPAKKAHHAARHTTVTRHAAPLAAGLAAGAAGAAAASATQMPAPSPDAPPADAPTDKGSNTGLPLPRYAALRADKVYMRRGPGDRYPIDWVYHRRGLPVEIEREFDVWRLVEDSDGQKGWVHQATLYGSRTFVIPGLPPEGVKAQTGEASEKDGDHIGRADARVLGHVATQEEARAHKSDVLLMSHPEEDSSVVAVLQPGTVGNIKACPQSSQWCHVVVKGYEGWLPRRLFWGLLPGETIQSN